MATTTNPAARLHALFSDYVENRRSANTGSIMTIWGKTLGLSEADDIRVRLAEVVALIDEVGRRLTALDKPAFGTMYSRDVAPVLMSCVVLTDVGTSTQVGENAAQVYNEQLNSLGALAAVLDGSSASVVEPSEDVLAQLRQHLIEALDAVRADTSLPPRIRQEIIGRLHDILWALDHLATVGPDEAMAAAERIGFLWEAVPENHRSSGLKKAFQAAMTVWVAFLTGAETVQAIETVAQIYEITQH